MKPQNTETTISVIITTADRERVPYLRDAVDAIRNQPGIQEIILPIDRDERAYRELHAAYRNTDRIILDFEPNGTGLSAARNRGAALATEPILAFIDDDTTAVPGWSDAIRSTYRDRNAIAVGGPAIPDWPDGTRPAWFPKQFDWLVGGGPYHDSVCEVRNTYGCNFTVRRDVFQDLGGFSTDLGKSGNQLQAEETEFATRFHDQYGERMVYHPDAAVNHRVFPTQLAYVDLLSRCYYQGVSKARMGGMDDTEQAFLHTVLANATKPPYVESVNLLAWTAATGLGYLVESLTGDGMDGRDGARDAPVATPDTDD